MLYETIQTKLPLPSVEPAIQEAVYALDTLKADGIVLLASSGAEFLGDPALEELMVELDRREAVVIVHLNIHPSSATVKLITYSPCIIRHA